MTAIQSSLFPEVVPEVLPPRDPAEIDAELKAKATFIGEHASPVDYVVSSSTKNWENEGHGPQPVAEAAPKDEIKLVGPAAARAALNATRTS